MSGFPNGTASRALAGLALLAGGCVTGSPPTLEPQTIPGAVVGRYYEVRFTASGSASVSAPSVPSGLELLTVSGGGLLLGVPRSEGRFSIELSAGEGGPTMFTNPARTERTYSLVVTTPGTSEDVLAFNPDVFLDARVGEQFSYDSAAAASGGQTPYRFTLYCVTRGEFCAQTNGGDRYQVPQGLAMTESGVLSGTVTGQGHWRFVVCVIDQSSEHACGTVELEAVAATGAPS